MSEWLNEIEGVMSYNLRRVEGEVEKHWLYSEKDPCRSIPRSKKQIWQNRRGNVRRNLGSEEGRIVKGASKKSKTSLHCDKFQWECLYNCAPWIMHVRMRHGAFLFQATNASAARVRKWAEWK